MIGTAVSPHNPFSFIATGWRHKELITQLAWRRIETRYRGSVFGLLWAVFEPLVMLTIYTFVFSLVFQARWGALPNERGEFALFLFSGLTIYAIFSESVNEAPQSIVSSEAFVKQLVFPTEILAWVSVVAALFKFTVSSGLLIIFYRWTQGNLPVTALLLPAVILPVIFLTLGVTWIFSSLGVFLRDCGQLVGLGTTALLFLSPIFYPASIVPERYRDLFFANPLAGVLEMSKLSLFEGGIPDPAEWLILFGVSWVVAWAGHSWFVGTKSSFADVL